MSKEMSKKMTTINPDQLLYPFPSESMEIDRTVGNRLKTQRILARFSQEALAKEIGVTFQQIQKYERGTNRIPASRLYKLSKVLQVPVAYFFQDAYPDGVYEESTPYGFEENDQVLQQLIVEYKKIKDMALRKKLLELARVLSV